MSSTWLRCSRRSRISVASTSSPASTAGHSTTPGGSGAHPATHSLCAFSSAHYRRRSKISEALACSPDLGAADREDTARSALLRIPGPIDLKHRACRMASSGNRPQRPGEGHVVASTDDARRDDPRATRKAWQERQSAERKPLEGSVDTRPVLSVEGQPVGVLRDRHVGEERRRGQALRGRLRRFPRLMSRGSIEAAVIREQMRLHR